MCIYNVRGAAPIGPIKLNKSRSGVRSEYAACKTENNVCEKQARAMGESKITFRFLVLTDNS